MKLRWSFRAANDRAPQCESRFPQGVPENPVRVSEWDFYLLLLPSSLFTSSHFTRDFLKVRSNR